MAVYIQIIAARPKAFSYAKCLVHVDDGVLVEVGWAEVALADDRRYCVAKNLMVTRDYL